MPMQYTHPKNLITCSRMCLQAVFQNSNKLFIVQLVTSCAFLQTNKLLTIWNSQHCYSMTSWLARWYQVITKTCYKAAQWNTCITNMIGTCCIQLDTVLWLAARMHRPCYNLCHRLLAANCTICIHSQSIEVPKQWLCSLVSWLCSCFDCSAVRWLPTEVTSWLYVVDCLISWLH